MTDSQVHTGETSSTRRAMLAGAGAVGASALLAACGTSEDDGSLADGDGGATTGSTPDTTTAPTTGAPAASQPAGGGGTRLSPAGDIPVEGGKIFADQQVVITQPVKGEFKGFTAVCPHAGCTVANVKDGVINCGCHGSQFSIEDGTVKRGPAEDPLDEIRIRVTGGSVFMSA
jgi:nitrite reductase/ring-hydroxylating ferredoxin subunit